MGSLAAGSAAAMGTGAFTSVLAERAVSVRTVGDPFGYLAITPTDERASVVNGELQLDFTSSNHGASGLNADARTTFTDLFRLKNQGDNTVVVAVGVNAADVDIEGSTTYQDANGGSGLLADQTGIDSMFVYAEEGGSGDGLGANGSVKMGVDAGGRVDLLQAGDPTAADETQYLDPGESLQVDMDFITNNSLNASDLNLDPGIVIMAVEPGSDRDFS